MSRHQIDLLLQLYRAALASNRVSYRRRPENQNTMAALGILPSEAFQIVAALRSEDALRPIRPNRHPGFSQESVCEFGTSYDGNEIYIKLTAVGTDREASAFIISFHFAEKPFKFLFK